jgi:hypothetical protein
LAAADWTGALTEREMDPERSATRGPSHCLQNQCIRTTVPCAVMPGPKLVE